jgi:hypothetical protein
LVVCQFWNLLWRWNCFEGNEWLKIGY